MHWTMAVRASLLGVGLYFAIFFCEISALYRRFFLRNLRLFSCVLRSAGDFYLTTAQRHFDEVVLKFLEIFEILRNFAPFPAK